MVLSFVILSTLCLLLVTFLRHKFQYWEKLGVPQPTTNYLGNFRLIKSMHKTELLCEYYEKFRGKAKLIGTYVFTKPIVIVLDLDLAKTILIKDFNKFTDRFQRRKADKHVFDILNETLFRVSGERWGPLRKKLSSTFTSMKMKFMFPTVLNVAQQMDEALKVHFANTSGGDIDTHDWMGRFTTDVIAHCAFGVECNSLMDPNSIFRHIGHRIFYPKYVSLKLRTLMISYPVIFKYLKFFHFNEYVDGLEEFVLQLVRETLHTREEQKVQRNDFIDLLIEMKNSQDKEGMPPMGIEEMASQVFVFFAAGFETSSSNLTYGLFELAKTPHVQEKLRAEIKSVLEKHNGQLTYESMFEMTYLDQVITETIRKTPAFAAITRVSTEDFKVPDSNITLEKGTHIYIPAVAIHYDPDIYDNPEEFRPERFDPEEVQKRHPQAFLGFGDGPRNCIGLRFARMQVRIGLITLLKSYRFCVSEKTPAQMELSKTCSVRVPGRKIWLKVEKL